jgi:hypothetical protein
MSGTELFVVILQILAVVFMAIQAFGWVKPARVHLGWLGLALLAASLMIPSVFAAP